MKDKLPKITALIVAAGVVLLTLISLRAASDKGGAMEKALRDLDAQWSAAAAAKDLDKTVSYYAREAVVLPPNKPRATTPEAIRRSWKEDLESMVSGGWTPTRIEVARSGDMAYATGTYEWVAKAADGKEMKDHGKYLEVWEKQADGTWKCGADCWNSDLPAAGANP